MHQCTHASFCCHPRHAALLGTRVVGYPGGAVTEASNSGDLEVVSTSPTQTTFIFSNGTYVLGETYDFQAYSRNIVGEGEGSNIGSLTAPSL